MDFRGPQIMQALPGVFITNITSDMMAEYDITECLNLEMLHMYSGPAINHSRWSDVNSSAILFHDTKQMQPLEERSHMLHEKDIHSISQVSGSMNLPYQHITPTSPATALPLCVQGGHNSSTVPTPDSSMIRTTDLYPVQSQSSSWSDTLVDSATSLRRERRRAQNRLAQQAYRARKEESIKEFQVKVEASQAGVQHMRELNDSLIKTVESLISEVEELRKQNAKLSGLEE